jgi:HSP20 family protein
MSNNLISLVNDFMMDDSFTSFMRPVVSRPTVMAPAMNLQEYDTKYVLKLKAPDLDAEHFSVEINDKILTISYQSNDEGVEESHKGEYLKYEWSTYQKFSRSVILSKSVDKESIEAEYEKGILIVEVQKTPEAQPKKISVKVKGK